MLREASFAEVQRLRIPAADCIMVARGRGDDDLAPDWRLLTRFKQLERQLLAAGENPTDAHNRAFSACGYPRTFHERITADPVAMGHLKQLSQLSRHRDIYLVCYEGTARACHRRILLRICERTFGAKIELRGVEIHPPPSCPSPKIGRVWRRPGTNPRIYPGTGRDRPRRKTT